MRSIPLLKVELTDGDIAEAVSVLRSGMLVQGAEVAKLEARIAEYLDVKHVIAVSNGTASLHMALVALGVGLGDEVIIPALSYIATANVVELVGATPIFVDVDIATFCIDSQQIEDKITAKTKAIIPVHEFGLISDINTICKIAKKHNIAVIEDAACALGATVNGKFAGTFGHVGSFSLHPRKAITSGEGGLITTNDPALARKFRILRNHGIDTIDGKIEFVAAGFNYRLTDFQAALVTSQLNRLEDSIVYKTELADVYMDGLNQVIEVKLPSVPSGWRHSWQTFHVVLNSILARDTIMSMLREKGVGTNYGAQCMPNEKYFANKYNLDCEKLFPNALNANQNGLALPLYAGMNKEDILYVIQSLKEILSQ